MTAIAADKALEPPATPVRVLIVDDDEAHAEAVAESLERLGRYECTVANSGARGAALVESDVREERISR
jgi:two-component system response regulator HydG